MARVNLIAALAENGVIGVKNRLPWRLPEDLAHFKTVTLGHPVVMGRKTFESLGRPLPGRRNIVITRTPGWHAAGAEAAASLDAALALCSGAPEVFVIGGAEIYALALPLADRLFLTEVAVAPEGDARFPEFDRSRFRVSARTPRRGALGDPLEFAFVVYERL